MDQRGKPISPSPRGTALAVPPERAGPSAGLDIVLAQMRRHVLVPVKAAAAERADSTSRQP